MKMIYHNLLLCPYFYPREQDKDPKDRPASVQIDTSRSIYEELDISSRLLSRTPRYFERTQEVHKGLSDTVKKAPLPSASSAFVHYFTLSFRYIGQKNSSNTFGNVKDLFRNPYTSISFMG